jgi:hypothetical protein
VIIQPESRKKVSHVLLKEPILGDQLTRQKSLFVWVKAAARDLKPGGILAVGGLFPDPPPPIKWKESPTCRDVSVGSTTPLREEDNPGSSPFASLERGLLPWTKERTRRPPSGCNACTGTDDRTRCSVFLLAKATPLDPNHCSSFVRIC